MSSAALQLEDYTRLQQNGNNGYVLPELVLAAIQQLCLEIGYDESGSQQRYIAPGIENYAKAISRTLKNSKV